MARTNGSIKASVGDGEVTFQTETPVPRKGQPRKEVQKALKAATKSKKPAEIKPVEVPKMDIHIMRLKIVGDAPLIVNKFSEKSKKQMLGVQMGTATEGRAPKDPEADFENSIHRDQDGDPCFPAIGFKASAVTACTSLKGLLTKTAVRQAFHVMGDMIKIKGSKPAIREDTVRVGRNKTADLRYRAEFKTWHCILTIRYNARALTDEQIVNLFNVAGFGVGVGEWRPERNGQFGLFHVE